MTVLWFRNDLRLEDNVALESAITWGEFVLPVFIYDDKMDPSLGGASQWWLHYALKDLERNLQNYGLRLIVRRGNPLDELLDILKVSGSSRVCWNRCYEPYTIRRDTEIKRKLREEGYSAESFAGSLLFDPNAIKNKQGKPYRVFTPYWKACLSSGPVIKSESVSLGGVMACTKNIKSCDVSDLGLTPKIPWDFGLKKTWEVTEQSALSKLQLFIKDHLSSYTEARDIPSLDGTSSLSAYLHFGMIAPGRIWNEIQKEPESDAKKCFLSEIGWREFAYYLLYHFPETVNSPLNDKFNKFPWAENTQYIKAWQQGLTGYPIVDAGMRQLYSTGWMHNRVRMIVGSFLVKHLLQDWKVGANWFWDTLVDADLASNTLGWQWVAGCGADAAPYFRIFNPVTQGQKFDPEGRYIKRYVPELKDVSKKYIHTPWELDTGLDYPKPIVDLKEGRERALSAFNEMKNFNS